MIIMIIYFYYYYCYYYYCCYFIIYICDFYIYLILHNKIFHLMFTIFGLVSK